mmetsp:Transcript_1942/g.3159  ORF Transcript_1942/g.3159 Transcript_1942/m.3159 type:complete len:208 (+) Transcript_1942:3603-4226(+)
MTATSLLLPFLLLKAVTPSSFASTKHVASTTHASTTMAFITDAKTALPLALLRLVLLLFFVLFIAIIMAPVSSSSASPSSLLLHPLRVTLARFLSGNTSASDTIPSLSLSLSPLSLRLPFARESCNDVLLFAKVSSNRTNDNNNFSSFRRQRAAQKKKKKKKKTERSRDQLGELIQLLCVSESLSFFSPLRSLPCACLRTQAIELVY